MIGQKLIAWYHIHKRHLPWRDTDNPYLIWVSEIILQQTRVNQGMGYYFRFTEAYPDITSLANAGIDDVLKLWQGLGYYSRARNMHIAARQVLQMHGGKFPETYRELLSIKGIGDYTASAVASFAFGKAVPVIDGNVNRVIARLYGIEHPVNQTEGKKMVRYCAEQLMIRESPGIYNQAIMEFGALQCVPHRPDCGHCLLNEICVAYRKNVVHMLPLKVKSSQPKIRYFHYLVVQYRNMTVIRQRSGEDIWGGLYEFPMIETGTSADIEELAGTDLWQAYFGTGNVRVRYVSPEIIHRLTHRILKVRFYEILIDRPLDIQGREQEILWANIHQYAVPKVIDSYLEKRETVLAAIIGSGRTNDRQTAG